ncbi:hypothetical protein SAMN05443247_04695 [Bradyrhizobium erythrophlei]|nr:hypothetical protein SAMN05443247_04695 [Bradyrhizobium erythrophlei]
MRRYLLILASLLSLALPFVTPVAHATNSTVSAMTAASALGGTELLYVVQGGADRKGTPAQIATYIEGLISGDCMIVANSIVCTKTNGVAFGTLATLTPGTGVATFLGTPSSANLLAALTTSTGTGSAVFGTAPTISSLNATTAMTLAFLTSPRSADLTHPSLHLSNSASGSSGSRRDCLLGSLPSHKSDSKEGSRRDVRRKCELSLMRSAFELQKWSLAPRLAHFVPVQHNFAWLGFAPPDPPRKAAVTILPVRPLAR